MGNEMGVGLGFVTQLVEYLLGIYKALGSIPSIKWNLGIMEAGGSESHRPGWPT